MAYREILLPWTQLPQEATQPNPELALPVEIWLPGQSSLGIVRGFGPSTEAVGTTPAGLHGPGLRVSATGRRYSQAELFGGASRYAWLVLAYREAGSTDTYSVVRGDGVNVVVQEANSAVRWGVWPGGGLVLSDYGAFSYAYTNYIGRVTAFAGRVDSQRGDLLLSHDGDAVVFVNFNSAVGTLPAVLNPLCFGATESASEVATPWVNYLTVVWCGEVPTLEQMEFLCRNPSEVFAPQSIAAPYSVVSAVPNITAVYADSVSTSSVTPRVTLDFA